MKTEEIISNHISKLSNNWFDRKLAEFQNAPYYNQNKLFNDQPIIKEYFTFDYDADGNEINEDIKLVEHDESKFNLTFKEFAVSSKSYYKSINLLSVYGDTDQWLTVSNYDPSKQIEDIETAAKLLAKKLFEYGIKFISQELYQNYLEGIIFSVRNCIDSLLDTKVEIFKSDYFECFRSEIEVLFSNYLEGEFFSKKDESLNFNLNLEELSAFLAIALNADIVNDKKELLMFASKFFKISNPKGEGHVYFLYKDFQDRLNKQLGNKKHRTKALEDINDKFYESFDQLMAFKTA